MNPLKRALIRSALHRRKRELVCRGQAIYHAYLLCCGSFKPGWKEKLENQMRALCERIERINRYHVWR